MNMNDLAGGALGVCMCSLQVARECGELLPAKTTWGRVVLVSSVQAPAVQRNRSNRPYSCMYVRRRAYAFP